MKDLYSFHNSEDDLDKYYEIVKDAYFKILERVDIKNKTYLTYASGGDFSKYSHEFQTVVSAGEDTIYICDKCGVAVNEEIVKDNQPECPECQNKKLRKEKAIETGNIFKLKDRFSRSFDFKYLDKDGKEKPILMGCYGLGPTRLMGTIVEIFNDKNGIIWPKAIAPFQIHLVKIGGGEEVNRRAEKIYKACLDKNIEMLFDDREESAGVKFKDADLIGIPIRIVVSEKTLNNNCVEVKRRSKDQVELIKISELNGYLEN